MARIISMLLLISILQIGCEPLVTTFDDIESAKSYRAREITTISPPDTLTVMTWNIRFGAARIPWFGDSCGKRVILSEDEVLNGLELLSIRINQIDPDLIFLQEVDLESKRTQYINQVQWLLDHTGLNYGVYASMWQAQVVPSDGLGRVNSGNAILSKWPLSDAKRFQLPLRGDQDALTNYFYLRRNALKARVELPAIENLFAVGIHTSAFSTDDTKKKQIDRFKEILDDIAANNGYFVAGGDLNELPPVATKDDYCIEDQCADETFHQNDDDHSDGRYFEHELTWLQDLYNTYVPAVSLTDYAQNESAFFTHTPDWIGNWDRKLDYLWTNTAWVSGSSLTLQEASEASDHVAVIARWEVP